MKIIQVTDLHIGSLSKDRRYSAHVSKIVSQIEKYASKKELLIILVCGDICDKGTTKNSDILIDVFKLFKEKLKEYKLSFEFVPGNHDMIDYEFKYFDTISSEISNNIVNFSDTSIIVRNYDDCDLVLINSAYHKDIDFGYIDFDKIEKVLDGPNKKIIAMHHGLLSRYRDDASSVRDAYRLIDVIKKHGVRIVLHGHVHAYSHLTVGDNCSVVSVGPFFSDQPDVNSQFNIVDINCGNLDFVVNCAYRKDLEDYTDRIVYKNDNFGCLHGISLVSVYTELCEIIKTHDVINNLHISIRQNYEEFRNEVLTKFDNEIDDALDWLGERKTDRLHYNHGDIINKDGDGVDYIISELMKKTTSSRAIISLLEPCRSYLSKDSFLPSLNVIQFGFKDDKKDELFVTLYLRALEVSKFFKINVCEAYLIAEKIRNKIKSIQNICLNLYAFRAQYKEGFGCFVKAEMDRVEQGVFVRLLCKNEFQQLSNMLQEKMDLKETVIVDSGFANLLTSIEICRNELGQEVCCEINDKICSILDNFSKLKSIREESSLHSDAIGIEEELYLNISDLIKSFNRIEGT